MDYERIKTLADELGCSVKDLIALAPGNDPFYCGTLGQKALGKWFAKLWRKFEYKRGVHLRRVHYQVVSQDPPVPMPNGLVYENTEGCWALLGQAAKAARYLELVDAAAFDDRRNPKPIVHASSGEHEPGIRIRNGEDRWAAEFPEFSRLPYYGLEDYKASQDYLLEVWCEKSTMNDVLEPLCKRYGANLVTALGELSVTAMLAAARRIEEDGRPARLLYISDFDPAGQCMPVSAARKLEYFVCKLGLEVDVRLFPVALTVGQCREYRLPRTPIKEKERRRNGFQERYGEGATELDALEALHPGELERIVRTAIRRYYDKNLDRHVAEAQQALEAAMQEREQAVMDAHRPEIEALREEHQRLGQDFAESMAGYTERQRTLWLAITGELEQAAPNLDDHPVPEAAEARELGEGLYDSEREYLDQIDAYKTFQGKA